MSQQPQQGQPPAQPPGQQKEGVGAMCCCCFDAGPVENDPSAGRTNMFQTTMCDAPCADPLCCCAGAICFPCAGYVTRQKVLDNDMTRYACCQGYFQCGSCFGPGTLNEQSCPECCLCLEACCCASCAINASRRFIMDQKGLFSDPCDRRIIRFNNCLQLFSCICSLVACLTGMCQDAAQIIRCIADVVACTVMGCMTAQVHHEIKTSGTGRQGGQVPTQQKMV